MPEYDNPTYDLQSNLVQLNRLNPNLAQFPGLSLSLGSSPTYLEDADTMSGFLQGVQFANGLKGYGPEDQADMLGAMTTEEQLMALGAGYTAPLETQERVEKKKGLWGKIWGGVKAPFGKVFHYLGAPLRFVQHTYRFTRYQMSDPSEFLTPDGQVHSKGFADAWRVTSDGDKLFYNVDEIQSDLSDDDQRILQKIALGTDIAELDEQFGAERVYNLQQSQEAQDYLSSLNDRKLSFGRDLAHTVGLHQGRMFHVVSGLADAAADWFADPLNKLPGVVLNKARQMRGIKLAARNTDDLYSTYNNGLGFRRAVHRGLSMFDENGKFDFARWKREFPQHDTVGLMFRDLPSEMRTPDGVIKMLAEHIAPYNPESAATGLGYIDLPRLSVIGQGIRIPVKMAAEKSIDSIEKYARGLADNLDNNSATRGAARALQRTAGFVRHATNQLPRREIFDQGLDPASRDAATYVHQFARLQHDYRKADEILEEFLAAKGDVGAQSRTLKKLYNDVFESMSRMYGKGVDEIEDLAAIRDDINFKLETVIENHGHMLDNVTAEGLHRTPSGSGKVAGEPLLTADIEDVRLPFPDPREMIKAVRTANWIHRRGLGGVADGMNKFMNNVWKPLALIKANLPIRAAIDESVLQMQRDGMLTIPQGWMASFGTRQGIKAEAKLLPRKGSSLRTPEELNFREFIAYRTHQAFSKTALKLTPDEYRDAADGLVQLYGAHMAHPYISGAFQDYAEGGRFALKLMKKGDRSYDYDDLLRSQVGFSDTYHPGIEYWRSRMQKVAQGPELDTIAPILRQAHEMTPREFVVSIREELKKMYSSPEYQAKYKHPRLQKERLERRFGQTRRKKPLAQKELLDRGVNELADRTAFGIKGLFFDHADRPISALTDFAAKNKAIPPGEWLAENLPRELRPAYVRRFKDRDVGSWDNAKSRFFDWSNSVINAYGRRPEMIHEMAKAMGDLKPYYDDLEKALGPEAARALHVERADDLAKRRLVDNIDQPDRRSMFAEWHSTAFPFWFAQEQFIKRWGKAIAHDPTILERMQLTMHGLRSTGFIKKNEDGQDEFVFVGTGAMQKALGTVLGKVARVNMTGFAPHPFTGKFLGIAPGISEGLRGAIPGASPLISMPLQALARVFPQASAGVTLATGDFAKNQSYWEMVVPGPLKQFINVFADEREHFNAVISSTLNLQSNPKTRLDEASTPDDQQEFWHRAEGQARVMRGVKAIFGVFSPTAPQIDYKRELNGEFLDLIKRMNGDIHEATRIFLTRHPDADIDTIFKSRTAVPGIHLPVSAKAGQVIDQSKGFFKKHGGVAAYFLPWDENGKYDPETYRTEIENGLRKKRNASSPADQYDLTGILQQSYIARAGPMYYEMLGQYKEGEANLKGAELTAWKQQWAEWSDAYKARHPVFKKYLELGPVRAGEREQNLQGLVGALNDPRRPRIAAEEEIRGLVQRYLEMKIELDNLSYSRTAQSREMRAQLQQEFVAYAESFTTPTTRMVYTSLMRPDLGKYAEINSEF